jgi:hypothetical protein
VVSGVSSFRKSSFSGGGGCAQVGFLPDGDVVVRDSKAPAVTALVFSPTEWKAFLSGVKAGAFEQGRPPFRVPRQGVDARSRLRPGVRLEVDLSTLYLNCDFRVYRRVAVGASVCDHPDALPTISRCPHGDGPGLLDVTLPR